MALPPLRTSVKSLRLSGEKGIYKVSKSLQTRYIGNNHLRRNRGNMGWRKMNSSKALQRKSANKATRKRNLQRRTICKLCSNGWHVSRWGKRNFVAAARLSCIAGRCYRPCGATTVNSAQLSGFLSRAVKMPDLTHWVNSIIMAGVE